MPIKPENRHHYTKAAGWPEIRAAVLKRATLPCPDPRLQGSVCCELCCVPNGRVIYRQSNGPQWALILMEPRTGWKHVNVVLTIAHINQDPTDNRMVNLLALCQRCHNRIDLPYRQRNAAATREKRHRIIPQNYSEDGK